VIRRFHRGLGIGLGLLYVFWIAHQGQGLPAVGIPESVGYTGKAGAGILVAYDLPLAAIVCFIWPERLMWWFSKRIPPDYEYLFTEGAWYVLGYVLLIIGVCVLLLFR
jgi:hypothetical protein